MYIGLDCQGQPNIENKYGSNNNIEKKTREELLCVPIDFEENILQ